MYTISWDPNPGSILRSTDKGATWATTTLPFKVGGNMPGRGAGEVSESYLKNRASLRKYSDLLWIQIRTIFFSLGQGKMVSGRAPTTVPPGPRLPLSPGQVGWKNNLCAPKPLQLVFLLTVSGFCSYNTGTYFMSTENEYTQATEGLAWVTFDSTSGVKGTATPRIFVGRFT